MLAFAIPLEGMKPIAEWDREVAEDGRRIQLPELAQGPVDNALPRSPLQDIQIRRTLGPMFRGSGF